MRVALDLAEAGRRVGRSEKAMRQLRAKGQGPKFHKLDGRVVVFEDDLEAWLDSAELVGRSA